MRRVLAILAICPALCLAADNVVTNYFAGYKYVPNTTTNAGDTALATNTAYLCFPLATLTGLTAAQSAEATGDVRAVAYAWMQALYTSYTASTNKTQSVVMRDTDYALSGTNINETVTQVLRTIRVLTTATYP